jgi:hypothetical protein
MPTTNKNTIISWFVARAKPLASQFAAWLDSYWHKDEMIPMASITGLVASLNGAATIAQVNALLAGIEGTFDTAAVKEIEIPAGAIYAGVLIRNLSNVDPLVFFIEMLNEDLTTTEYLAESTLAASEKIAEQQRIFGPCTLFITTLAGAASFKIFK